MVTVKEVTEFLAKLPPGMPVGLIDLSTDNCIDSNYPLTIENFFVEDYVEEEGGEVKGKMVFIGFKNHLNENPI